MTRIVTARPTAMTPMSDRGRGTAHSARGKRARSWARGPLARALHDVGVLRVACIVLAPVLVACVIPPPLSNDQPDAQPNSPPGITSVRGADGSELQYPGPVAFTQGSGEISLTLIDTDIGDTLYVDIFVNYGEPNQSPPRATCEAASGTIDRITTCALAGLCESADIGQVDENMTIVVSDRQPLESGTLPLYQALPPGGLSTERLYLLNCQAPTP